MSEPTGHPPLPRRSVIFRPRFTVMLFYLALFTVLFALLFALPDLIAGARALPPGPEELTPEELEQAREITRGALAGGKMLFAFVSAVIVVGVGAWKGSLPGIR